MMISQSLGDNEEFNSVYAMYDVLKGLCLNNAEYFKADDSDIGKKFVESFDSLHNNVVSIYPLVDEIRKAAPHYDFSQNTPGNGYRSFVTVVDAFILYGEKICQQICKGRGSYFFRKNTYLREVETCSQALSSLAVILSHLKTLISWSDPGCLYPRDERSPEDLLSESPGINQMCFYGSCLGFQEEAFVDTELSGDLLAQQLIEAESAVVSQLVSANGLHHDLCIKLAQVFINVFNEPNQTI